MEYDREKWLNDYCEGYDGETTEFGTPLSMIGKWQMYGTTPIKYPSDLKWLVEFDKENVFFSSDNMRFFGDTMRNFGLRKPKEVIDIMGDVRFAYELYRRRPVKNGLASSAWFEIHKDGTVRRVYLAED